MAVEVKVRHRSRPTPKSDPSPEVDHPPGTPGYHRDNASAARLYARIFCRGEATAKERRFHELTAQAEDRAADRLERRLAKEQVKEPVAA